MSDVGQVNLDELEQIAVSEGAEVVVRLIAELRAARQENADLRQMLSQCGAALLEEMGEFET